MRTYEASENECILTLDFFSNRGMKSKNTSAIGIDDDVVEHHMQITKIVLLKSVKEF